MESYSRVGNTSVQRESCWPYANQPAKRKEIFGTRLVFPQGGNDIETDVSRDNNFSLMCDHQSRFLVHLGFDNANAAAVVVETNIGMVGQQRHRHGTVGQPFRDH